MDILLNMLVWIFFNTTQELTFVLFSKLFSNFFMHVCYLYFYD